MTFRFASFVFVLAVAPCAAFALALGCSSTKDPQKRESAATAVDPRRLQRYPLGRWRLASPAELAQTALFASHILVMHRDSSPRASELRAKYWVPDTVPPRSEEEAVARAWEIAELAQKDPTQFERLAREMSDDVVTRAGGGSLGVRSATQLPATLLDALAVMHPGQISAVVPSGLGFHVLMKRAPPPKEEVSGRRVIIRYRSTFGDGPSDRERGAALALARRIVAEARAGADFASLVERYSEGIDRVRGGDLGVQATTDPGNHSLLIEALARVKVGEVLDEPVDTIWGFQVAKREPLKTRVEYAAHVVRKHFSRGNAAAASTAEAMAKELAKNAGTDPSLLRDAPEAETMRWFDGHGDPALTNAVAQLRFGVPAAITLHNAYAVVERVDPKTLCPDPEVRYELPAPRTVNVESIVQANEGGVLAESVNELRAVVPKLGLSATDIESLQASVATLHSELLVAKSPDAVVGAYRANLARLRERVSEASYGRITTAVDEWLVAKLMSEEGP